MDHNVLTHPYHTRPSSDLGQNQGGGSRRRRMPGDICPEGLQVAPGPSGRDEARDRTRSRKPSPELGEEPKKSRPGGRRSKVSPGGALQVRRPRWSGHFLTKPIFCICAFLASASTLARTPYSACSLTSISSVGWLLTSRWTSVSIMLRSAASGVGLSFQKILPDWSIRRRIGSGGSRGLRGGLIDRCVRDRKRVASGMRVVFSGISVGRRFIKK